MNTLGEVKNFTHSITLNKNAAPYQAKLRRLPLAIRDQVSDELHRLESTGVY